ncbi:MAG: hypothetical protein L0312_18640, partial [Acidobacteria bacterium]|nr:hypothetical protein [Acidobacteriota bacterium]
MAKATAVAEAGDGARTKGAVSLGGMRVLATCSERLRSAEIASVSQRKPIGHVILAKAGIWRLDIS